MRQTISL